MPKIAFLLRKDKITDDGLSPIYVKVEINNKRYNKSLGHKIKERHWLASQTVSAPKKKEETSYDYREINDLIKWYKDNWGNLIHNRLKSEITEPMVLDFLNRKKISKTELFGKDFWEALDEYVIKNTEVRKWRPRTIRNLNTLVKTLKLWNEETSYNASFNRVTMDMYESLVIWCNNTKKYELNTSDKIISTLRAFLNWAKKKGYYTGTIHHDFKGKTENVTIVFLTEDEFYQLFDFKFESSAKQKARDIFCFTALTGQRVGDIRKLRREHIVNNYWRLTTEKTDENITIPIVPLAQEIIARYKHPVYVMPRMSEPVINRYIKKCCKDAGITTPITVTTYPGGSRKDITVPKYEKITIHKARVTHVTLGLASGIESKIIRSITGHKKDSVFDKYAHVVDELKRTKLEEAWKRPEKKTE